MELCFGRGLSCPLSCGFGLAFGFPLLAFGLCGFSLAGFCSGLVASHSYFPRAQFSCGLGLVSSHAASAWRFLGSASFCCAVKSLPWIPSGGFSFIFPAFYYLRTSLAPCAFRYNFVNFKCMNEEINEFLMQ